MKSRLFKNVVGAVAVMSLVFTTGAIAFAADSPVAEIPAEVVEIRPITDTATVTIGGQEKNVKVEVDTTEQKAPNVKEAEDALAAAGQNVTIDENTKLVAIKDVVLRDQTTGEILESGPLDTPLPIQFEIEGVKVGDTVIVLNYYDGAWHYVKAEVTADGVVTATFDHLSPVAFIVKKATGETTPTDVTDTKTEDKASADTQKVTTKTSPKTGE
ncbi:MAG: hypothetical protein PHN80_06935 [Hespellia sp.]|nr:hypothetical protein [Hespellia sp.]